MGMGDCSSVCLMVGYSMGLEQGNRKLRAAVGRFIPTRAIHQIARRPAEAIERPAVPWVLEFVVPAHFPREIRSATQPAWRTRRCSPVGFASPAFAGFAFIASLPDGKTRVCRFDESTTDRVTVA